MSNDPKSAGGMPEMDRLPEWAQRAVKSAVTSSGSARIPADRDSASWPLLVEAAVVSGFLPRELAPTSASGAARAAAEQNVVELAEPLYGAGGPRWSLRPEARSAILNVAIKAGDIEQAVQQTEQRFSDPVSTAIRKYLTGTFATPGHESMEELEARRLASSLLSDLPGLQLKVADLDREIGLRRLLAPFERMIGRRAATDASSEPEDRFFGRDSQMDTLRDYVGMLGSGVAASVRQIGRRAAAAISGREAVCVFGIGGVGKTTLMAKFMLEHAASKKTPFPFAYLDFDRAMVSARDTVGLFSEICSQVATQLPELAQTLGDLRTRARDTAKRIAVSQESGSSSYLMQYLMEFRRALDKYLDKLESAWEWARPFLLVFDTFEVAQYSPDDVAELETFIRNFAPSETTLWPRLRLVIAGRKQVTSFLGSVEPIPLDELDEKGSVDMLLALASDAGKPLPKRDAERLIRTLAKACKSETGGLRPLRLRLLGELFRHKDLPGDGPAIAASLTKDFSGRPNPTGVGSRALIDGLLTRRVLLNVIDDRVRALADPGLVVRRITPEVIREVMTKCSSKPGTAASEKSEQTATEPWILGPDEENEIYNAFKKEVSLVEEDAGGLRHRQDVRLDVLPLIEAQSRSQFLAIHRLAYEFFSAGLTQSDAGANRAEAIYHGLWLGEPFDRLDALWPDTPDFDPRIDPAEFPGDSLAIAFLRAKHGERLTPAELKKLSLKMRLKWLDRCMPDFMAEQRVSAAVDSLRAIGLEDIPSRRPLAADSVRLLYRGGLWADAMKMIGQSLGPAVLADSTWANDESFVSTARTGMTILAKSYELPENRGVDDLLQMMQKVTDPLARFEMHAHWALGSMGKRNFREVQQIRIRCGDLALQVNPREWQHNQRILRLAILTILPGDGMNRLGRQLLSWYFEGMERLPRERRASAFRQQLLAQLGIKEKERYAGEHTMQEWDRIWQSRRKELMASEALQESEFSVDVWRMIAHDHPDWIRPLGNALADALQGKSGDIVLSSLVREEYNPSRTRDGFTTVQSVYDQGRLLDFADTMLRLGKPQPGLPQDVYGIATALLSWQDRINRLGPYVSTATAG